MTAGARQGEGASARLGAGSQLLRRGTCSERVRPSGIVANMSTLRPAGSLIRTRRYSGSDPDPAGRLFFTIVTIFALAGAGGRAIRSRRGRIGARP